MVALNSVVCVDTANWNHLPVAISPHLQNNDNERNVTNNDLKVYEYIIKAKVYEYIIKATGWGGVGGPKIKLDLSKRSQ